MVCDCICLCVCLHLCASLYVIICEQNCLFRQISCTYCVNKSSLNIKIPVFKIYLSLIFINYLLVISIIYRIWFCLVCNFRFFLPPVFTSLKYCYYWGFLLGNLPLDTAIMSEVVLVDVNNGSMYVCIIITIIWYTAIGKYLPISDTVIPLVN